MRVAILAGGQGTRMGRESGTPPKPLIEIGGRPVLWHILRLYAWFGHADVVIALGHRIEEIVQHFLQSPVWWNAVLVLPDGGTVDRSGHVGDWRIQLVDTGRTTASAGRIRRLRPCLDGETFMLTWCDGLADVEIPALIDFHRRQGRIATLTAVHPPSPFGRLELDGDRVAVFREKAVADNEWVNGAFFVIEPSLFEAVELSDDMPFEARPLEHLAASGQLGAFRHESFWQCMDTEGDRARLDRLWAGGQAPWKIWTDDDARARNRQ